MKTFTTENIRNLAVIGHGDAGKTQLVSSLLHVAGTPGRWGKVDEGTTVTDYEEDSIARKVSLNNNLAHLEYKDTKVNLIDTPGYAAFVSHARPALRVADCAMVVVDAVHGIEVQTEKTWQYANEFLLPRFMVINKIDKEHADFGHALETAASSFARSIVPFTLPIGAEGDFKGVVDVVHQKAYEFDAAGKAKEIPIPDDGKDVFERTRERIIELVAESDDALMEEYFENGTLPEDKIYPNLAKAIASSKLCPVYAISATTLVGLQILLDHIVEFAPTPATHEAEWGFADNSMTGDHISKKYSESEPFSAYVFRTIADPFAGRISLMKIISGKLTSDANVYNSTRETMERLGPLHVVCGKTLDKVNDATTGDIIACVKLKDTQTGDTLCDKAHPIVYPPVQYPEPAISFAIEPKSRADEDKISQSLHRILEEDPSLHFDRDRADKGIHPLRLGPASHRDGRRQAQGPLSRRGHAAPAKGAVQGDDHRDGRGAGPSQEAVGRTRAVWRLQGHLRTAASRLRFRMGGQDLWRLRPAEFPPGDREGHHRGGGVGIGRGLSARGL